MHRRSYTQHQSDVEEVEEDAANGSPEAHDISSAYTLAKEDTVMVHIFNTDATVLTMFRI